jgi:N-acetylmuramoyl-L-alanine amidase
VSGFFRNRFFFILIIAFFVCLSFSLLNSWGRQLEYDFKLPDVKAFASANAAERILSDAPTPISVLAIATNHAFITGEINNNAYEAGDIINDNGESIFNSKYKQTDPIAITKDYYIGTKSMPNTAFLTETYDDINAIALFNGANALHVCDKTSVVVLDAGHGGADPGSFEKGICEKDITLQVARRTAEFLDEAGIPHIMTRTDDDTVSLEQRLSIIRNESSAMLISIHCDWFEESSINGTSTLYDADNEGSKSLAALIQANITAGLDTADRSVHPHKNILLLRDLAIPAVIVELGFFSNEHDLSLMNTETFREQAAYNLANSIYEASKRY